MNGVLPWLLLSPGYHFHLPGKAARHHPSTVQPSSLTASNCKAVSTLTLARRVGMQCVLRFQSLPSSQKRVGTGGWAGEMGPRASTAGPQRR